MASSLRLGLCTRLLRNMRLTGTPASSSVAANRSTLPVQPPPPLLLGCRSTSFFVKMKADDIWKGITSVSNAGRRRGRGKRAGKRFAKDLNRGQVIGVGKSNMVWPGLNAPVIRGREVIERRQLPPDPEREERLLKLRDSASTFRSLKLSPLERGWSGTKMPGRSMGPPEPIGDETFEGFDSKVLEMKAVVNMSGNLGRKRRMSTFLVIGNKNGVAGFGLGKASEGKAAIRKAKNRAAQRLVYIERYNEHTVCHDFFTAFGTSKLYVKQKPEGYGLVCHRALRCVCEMIGIKNIHVKLEGSNCVQNMVKSFFLGLLRQRTHQQLANEKGLYLVEFREENGDFPNVVAAPEKCRTESEIPRDEELNYKLIVMEGKVQLEKPKPTPFYMKLPSWQNHILKTERYRNHYQYKVQTVAEQGELTSFILKKDAQNRKDQEATQKDH